MAQRDSGLHVVERIYEELQIDDEWASQEERGFAWWGHRQRQHVWSDEPIDDHGERVWCVHAETDLGRAAELEPPHLLRLARINRRSALNAVVWDESEGRIFLHAKVYVHAASEGWSELLLRMAAGLQAGRAHQMALAGYAEQLGATVDASDHPSGRSRDEADEMLTLVGKVADMGLLSGAAFDLGELQELSGTEEDVAVLSNMDERRGTAEFVCLSARTAGEAMLARLGGSRASGPPGTALLQISLDEEHPVLGPGCFMKLELPLGAYPDLDVDNAAGALGASKLANSLNEEEVATLTRVPLAGAWTVGDSGPAFVSFLPQLMARRGLLRNLYVSQALRAAFMGAKLTKVERD